MGTKTTTLKNGTKVTRATDTVPEWKLQASQVRRLRNMPEYGRSFLIVGGMEAGRRGPQTATIAKATGLTAGHPDVTIFLTGARVAFIENKTTKGRLSPAQKDWHEKHNRLGCEGEGNVAANENEAGDK